MAEEFVRKDVFDASIQRVEAVVDKSLAEVRGEMNGLRGEMNEFRSELKGEMAELRNEMRAGFERVEQGFALVNTRIDAVNTRVDSVQTSVYWGFAIMGIVLALTTFTPVLAEFMRSLRRPSVTMEDVERVVHAAIRQAGLEGR